MGSSRISTAKIVIYPKLNSFLKKKENMVNQCTIKNPILVVHIFSIKTLNVVDARCDATL